MRSQCSALTRSVPCAVFLCSSGPLSGSVYSCLTFSALANVVYSIQVCSLCWCGGAEGGTMLGLRVGMEVLGMGGQWGRGPAGGRGVVKRWSSHLPSDHDAGDEPSHIGPAFVKKST